MSTLPYHRALPPLTPEGSAAALERPAKASPTTPELLGNSPAIQRLRTLVRRLGPHFRTVLLQGEVGTGKELVARALHGYSSHASGPFVVFQCALKGNNEDSKHTSSMRPVASDLRTSLQKAHRGTLYVDQIGLMTSSAQRELLDSLQRRDRSRISEPILVHGLEARVIVSTNEDLKNRVAEGRFSEDLYKKISTVEVDLPSLRERPEDIPEFVQFFMAHFAERYNRHLQEISAETLDKMRAYPWPGNIEELKDRIRRAVVECETGRIEAKHLCLPIAEPTPQETAELVRLQDVVEQHVLRTLQQCAGNKVRAAELLGISRSTLYRMLDSGMSAEKIVASR